ncbi:MAG: amidohydrolase, partial [Bifidobacteriaceae bacterium]|nr:amidohydrolase [Bifidobacteriaceae bacterium]
DIHPHVIAADERRYRLAPVGGQMSAWARSRPVTTEALIAAMDRTGVAQAVIVQASTAYGYDNSSVTDSAGLWPGRLAAVACVNPLSHQVGAEIDHWVAERGAAGLRLFAAGSTIGDKSGWLDSPDTFPAWEAALRHRTPVCVQTRFSNLARLRTMLERFPGVRVVLDHMAYPDLTNGPAHAAAEPLLALADCPNLYLKLTLRNLEPLARANGGPTPFLRRLVDAFGADRIAWGSNFPAAANPLCDLVALAVNACSGLGPDERRWIAAGTARRLYPALADAKSPSERGLP